MKSDNFFMTLLQKATMGILGFMAAMVGIMGYYPLIPAFDGTYCLRGKKNGLVYVGLLSGMFLRMSFQPFMKYLFILSHKASLFVRLFYELRRDILQVSDHAGPHLLF